MSTEIEAKEVTVGKLFSPDFMFQIPIYQRPLSWESDNFDQLFEDIFDAMTNNERQYFLGSIILQEHEKEKNTYYLVDGQQRISALAILLVVIRDFTGNSKLKQKLNSYLYQEEDEFKGIPSEMRIISWEELKGMFKKCVYEIQGTQKFMEDFKNGSIKYNDTLDPRYHLYEAINVFNEKLDEKLQSPEELEKFVKYLLNQVYLVYIKTKEFTSAFRLFDVLNTRGLPLTTSDLLKSENIGVIPDQTMRLKYANIWRNIEDTLGREQLENVITFIRTMKTKEKAKLSIYEEYQKKIFEKGLLKKGVEFIDHVKEISDIYSDKILDARIHKNTGRENEYRNIVTIMRNFVPFSDWIPPLISFYHKFKIDGYLLDFILKLEKKVILEWIARFSYTERITSLNRIIKFIEDEKNPQKVVNGLLFYEGGEDSTGRSARMLDFSNKDRLSAILTEALDDSQFYNLHGGKLAKYILLRIDMKHWEIENFPGYPGAITVEHILPQNPPKNSQWVEIFNEAERMDLTNKLGNLVLLSGRKNSRAQNYYFEKKKIVYFKEKSTPFRITQYLENIDNWTPKELKERHQKLINDAKEIFLNY